MSAKTIKINDKLELELTPERRRRIEQAMIETMNKRDKEMQISADLRHHDMVKSYNEHIAYLQGLLA